MTDKIPLEPRTTLKTTTYSTSTGWLQTHEANDESNPQDSEDE